MSFSINVKTVSQLPEASINNILSKQEVANKKLYTLLEVSVPLTSNNGSYAYISNKVPIMTFTSAINQRYTSEFLNDNYGLSADRKIGDEVTELNTQILEKIQNPINDEYIIFKKSPYIGQYDDEDKILTTKEVNNVVDNKYKQLQFSNNSIVERYGILKALYYNDADDNEENTLDIAETGNLVLNGWISDNGNVALGNAWVALQIKINKQWQTVQLQPWILGERHKQVQLVSFNLPIGGGSRIRVVTGFVLNESNSGLQITNNSIVDSTPNRFVVTLFK